MMMLLKLLVKLHFTLLFPGLNVVFLKLAIHSKPSMEILVVDDAVKIIFKASFYFYISRVKCCIPEVSNSF